MLEGGKSRLAATTDTELLTGSWRRHVRGQVEALKRFCGGSERLLAGDPR